MVFPKTGLRGDASCGVAADDRQTPGAQHDLYAARYAQGLFTVNHPSILTSYVVDEWALIAAEARFPREP